MDFTERRNTVEHHNCNLISEGFQKERVEVCSFTIPPLTKRFFNNNIDNTDYICESHANRMCSLFLLENLGMRVKSIFFRFLRYKSMLHFQVAWL